MSKSCIICAEKFNKSNRKELCCMYCEFIACRTCCQTFILNETDPKCMNTKCARPWTRKFLTECFPTSFINGPYKNHRENVLFDRERALLPATQPYAEAKNVKINISKEIKLIDTQMAQLAERRRELYRLQRLLVDNPVQALEIIGGCAAVPVESRRQFIKPCSIDDCRGFLSCQWKCGLCETWSCPDCHMVIGASKTTPHTCDPNNVESAKMLKAETKPCPKCAASIFKIDGCDQMWCTQCHTAFSWKSGKIETRIHNPHYYEWLRNTQGSVPRDPADNQNPCGEIRFGPDMIRQFQYFVLPGVEPQHLQKEKISAIIRSVIHHQEITLAAHLYEERNRDIRIQYLTKEINEHRMKILLQQQEKKHNKKTEIQEVVRMVTTAAGDILQRYLSHLRETSEHSDRNSLYMEEFVPLHRYANELLTEIHKTYGSSTVLIFNERFQFNR